MSAFASLLLTNAATAGVLALLAWTVSRLVRRQAVVHGLWLLAIVKLVTPPLLPLPVLPSWTHLLFAPPAVVRVPIPRSWHREAGALAAARVETTSVDAARTLPAGTDSVPAELDRSEAERAPHPAPAADVPPSPGAVGSSMPGDLTPGGDLTTLAGSLLLAGALAILALTAWRFLRFRRLLAGAIPADEQLARRTELLGRRLGLRRTPTVWLLREELPPLLWPSAAGARLVLPAGLLAHLAGQELDTLLVHELAHVRRGDHWVRFVEVAATALFWWYPVAWWARRALRRAEERCCDEWVLRVLPASAQDYANGLLKSLTFVSGGPASLPAGASGAGPVRDLEARLKEILMTRPCPQINAPLRVALALAAATGLAVFPTRAASARADDDTPATTAKPTAAPAAPAQATKAAPARASAAIVVQRVIVGPRAVRLVVTPRATTVSGGVAAGVPGGVAAGVPGGVVGGVSPFVAVATPGPLAAEDDDPAVAAERRALEDQRRALHAQEQDLERKSLELEARAQQARFKAEADRLRAEGRTAELAQVEKRARLESRQLELQRAQLELEEQRDKMQADLERAARDQEQRAAALEKAGQGQQAEQLRGELDKMQEQREQASQDLEKKEAALQAELEDAERDQRALEAEERVSELRESGGEIEQTLRERIGALREALPSAGAQRPALEREIRKLETALQALGGPAAPPAPRRSTKPSTAAPGKTPSFVP